VQKIFLTDKVLFLGIYIEKHITTSGNKLAEKKSLGKPLLETLTEQDEIDHLNRHIGIIMNAKLKTLEVRRLFTFIFGSMHPFVSDQFTRISSSK
jgi:hypothetical protein